MKKASLLLYALLSLLTLRAQSPEKNILGVRAGVEIGYIRAWGETVYGTTNARIGFRLGVSDQVLLWHALPLYVETGVHFSSRGGRYKASSFRPMYLQIPVMLTYRFRFGERVCFRPFAGVAYGVGIGGMAHTPEGWAELFGQGGFLRRSDLNVRAGVEVSFHRISLHAGYDAGCRNLLRRGETTTSLLPSGISELRNRSISIGIGYDF